MLTQDSLKLWSRSWTASCFPRLSRTNPQVLAKVGAAWALQPLPVEVRVVVGTAIEMMSLRVSCRR